MKVVAILIILTCVSCVGGDADKNVKEHNMLNKTPSIEIFGEWNLCQVVSESSKTSYNVCSIVRFYANYDGEFIKPSREVYPFKWVIDEKKINLSLNQKVDRSEFFSEESEFYYEIKDKENNIVLELTSINNSHKYILLKNK